MEDEFLEMMYEDRYYIPDDDDYSDDYELPDECLDCWEVISDEGLCGCE